MEPEKPVGLDTHHRLDIVIRIDLVVLLRKDMG